MADIKYKLYIIFSNKNLNYILEIILNNSPSQLEVGPLRRDYTRDAKTGKYKNSNRRFIILSTNVFKELVKNGFGDENNEDFYIDEYEIRLENRSPLDSLMHFYYPENEKNKTSLVNKLKFIENMGFLKSEDYCVHNCIVEFSNKVNDYIRIILKIILDDVNCRVSWCRKTKFKKYNSILNF